MCINVRVSWCPRSCWWGQLQSTRNTTSYDHNYVTRNTAIMHTYSDILTALIKFWPINSYVQRLVNLVIVSHPVLLLLMGKFLSVSWFSSHWISFWSKTKKKLQPHGLLARALEINGPYSSPCSWKRLWGSDDGCARLKLNVQSLAYHRHSLTACTCRIPIIQGNDRSLPALLPQSCCETEWSLSAVGLSSALTAHHRTL